MPKQFYKSRDIRILFGSPGRPISPHSLKRYRDCGIGPLPGNTIKTRIPFVQVNTRYYLYPKGEIDELIEELHKMAQNQI